MFTASMTFDLGDDVNALRDMVHAWAQAHLKPMAAQIDRDNLFPPALWRDMGDLGLLGVTVDETYGGAGMSYLAHTVAVEVLRGAFKPVRQPDQTERHRRAKDDISAAPCLR
jgi:isovaleryl-CoA dehydrogenase